MRIFEIVIALVLAGAGLTALSRRIGAPYPAMLALAGAAIALVPGTPTLALDPELALTLFVAPVLLDSAFDASARDLRDNWRTVTSLAVGTVVVTVAAVAVVARWVVPALPWPVAIALGAIVAPSDAAAATAVLDQLRPPHRLLVILEGESLFNDASALLVYRMAVAAVLAGVISPASAIPSLFFVMLGSVVLGYVLSRIIIPITTRIHDVALVVVVQFCGTFAVWMIAERVHLSGILTMVTFAMVSTRRVAYAVPARVRLPSYAVWEFAVFVLNVLAFILVGFQLKAIVARVDARTLAGFAGVGAAVCGAAIVARMAWVWVTAAVDRSAGRAALSTREATVVGWCGMRGIVTLAAALAIPTNAHDGAAFPFRDLVVFASFSVVLGTLVLQGMTLRPLMNALSLEDDGSVEREVRLARVETLRAALAAIDGKQSDEIASLVRRRYEVVLRRAERAIERERSPRPRRGSDDDAHRENASAVQSAIRAERQRLLALRDDGTIGDTAFQRLEQELDLEEVHLGQLAPSTSDETASP